MPPARTVPPAIPTAMASPTWRSRRRARIPEAPSRGSSPKGSRTPFSTRPSRCSRPKDLLRSWSTSCGTTGKRPTTNSRCRHMPAAPWSRSPFQECRVTVTRPRIESDGPVVADRMLRWAQGDGAHAETSLAAPALRWHLAEGSTSGDFSLFYLLQNPSPQSVTATIRYLRPGALPPIVKTYALMPLSRRTIPVDDEDPALASTDCRRSSRRPRRSWSSARSTSRTRNGRSSPAMKAPGVTEPSTTWFLAEGATGAFFDTFILIANPGSEAASLTVDYLLSDGRTLQKTYTAGAESRLTIWVDDEELPLGSGLTPLAAVNFSSPDSRVASGDHRAHDVVARSIAHLRLLVPGPRRRGTDPNGTTMGACRRSRGPQHQLGHLRPHRRHICGSGECSMTVFPERGTTAERVLSIAPNSRFTVPMTSTFGLSDIQFRRDSGVDQRQSRAPRRRARHVLDCQRRAWSARRSSSARRCPEPVYENKVRKPTCWWKC